ncbi:Thioesterase domain-containing protein [Pseudomonas sp. IT-P171]|uniref:thioesterase domain-containing protein n=1 Tax=Pseudomonas sp. IT-P171 TaxID=3026453 RepID=UPI0039DFAE34
MTSFIEQSLNEIWSFTLGRKDIGENDNFFALGGDSLLALATIEQIKQRLGWSLNLGDLLRYPTIRELATDGSQLQAANQERAIIRMSNRGSKIPIIFIHPVSGLVFAYSKLVQRLGHDRGCYGIQPLALANVERLQTIEQIAEHYANLIFDDFGEEDFHLVGWSLGGLIGYEIAKIAADKGLNLRKLVLIDSYIWEVPTIKWDEAALLEDLRNDLLAQVAANNKFAVAAESADPPTTTQEITMALFGQEGGKQRSSIEFVHRLIQMYRANIFALVEYRPTMKPTHGLLLHVPENDSIETWHKLSAGKLTACPIAGSHYGLLQDQHATTIATLIENYLLGKEELNHVVRQD